MPPSGLPVSLVDRVRGYFYRFCPAASLDFAWGITPGNLYQYHSTRLTAGGVHN
jgi:hypothetical protein